VLDIVFFGEKLPERFSRMIYNDIRKVDFLIVIGTSLQVQPFASIIDLVPEDVPRLLINMEVVGEASRLMKLFGQKGFEFGKYRDVKWIGDCQEGVLEF